MNIDRWPSCKQRGIDSHSRDTSSKFGQRVSVYAQVLANPQMRKTCILRGGGKLGVTGWFTRVNPPLNYSTVANRPGWQRLLLLLLLPPPPAPARGPYINRKHPDSAVRSCAHAHVTCGVHMSTCAWKAATNAQSKSHGETPHSSARTPSSMRIHQNLPR